MERKKYNTKLYYPVFHEKMEFEQLLVPGLSFYTFEKLNYVYIGEGRCYCLEKQHEVLLTSIYDQIRAVWKCGNYIAKRKTPESELTSVQWTKKKKKRQTC